MTEVLFVLTVIYVAYVFYVAINDKKTQIKTAPTAVEPEKQAISITPVPQKEQLKTKPQKTIKATTIKKSTPPKKGLKNPKTGEIATTYSNYIFTKRWIKEALVAEGLLEKIYKNNELNPEIESSIKAAIAQLEAMDYYKV